MATKTISNAGGNWNATTTWVEGVIPVATDDIVATATSGNLTINVAANCRSLDLPSYRGVLTINAALSVKVPAGYDGWCRFSPNMTIAGTNTLYLLSVAGQELTFSPNGCPAIPVTINMNNASGYQGTIRLGSDFSILPTKSLIFMYGSFYTDNYDIDAGNFGFLTTGIKKLYLGSSTLRFRRDDMDSTAFNNGSTGGLTVDPGTSTVVLVGTTNAYTKTLKLGGVSLNNVVVEGGGASRAAFDASNSTINTLTIAAGKTVTFGAGATLTITGTVACRGTEGNAIVLQSSVAGTPAMLAKADGMVAADYLSLQDIAAGGGARWYAGRHSQDVSGNSGWVFDDPFLPAAVTAPSFNGAPFGGQRV